MMCWFFACTTSFVYTWCWFVRSWCYRIINTNSTIINFHAWTRFFCIFCIPQMFKIYKTKSTRSSCLQYSILILVFDFIVFFDNKFWKLTFVSKITLILLIRPYLEKIVCILSSVVFALNPKTPRHFDCGGGCTCYGRINRFRLTFLKLYEPEKKIIQTYSSTSILFFIITRNAWVSPAVTFSTTIQWNNIHWF